MKKCTNCVDLKDEVTSLQNRYNHLEGYYYRANAAYESLVQDMVNFLSDANGCGHIPPHSIFGGQLLEALGKANRLYHGTK